MSVVIHGINFPLLLSMDVETHLLRYKLYDYTRHDGIRSFLMGKPQSRHEQSPAPDVLLLLNSVNSLLVSRVGNESVTLNVSFMKRTITPVSSLLTVFFLSGYNRPIYCKFKKRLCGFMWGKYLFVVNNFSIFFSSWDRVLLHIQSGLELRVFCSLEC